MKSMGTWAVAAALLVTSFASAVAEMRIGTKIDDFTLHDYRGAAYALSDWRDKKAVVITFLGIECPLAKQYAARLAELSAKYEPQGVAFVGIDANQQDSLAEIAHFARQHKIEF